MFGEQLRIWRKKRNLTQAKLGEIIGVTGAYIQQLELGRKTNPSLEIVMKLCSALEIAPFDLDYEFSENEMYRYLMDGSIKKPIENKSILPQVSFEKMKATVNSVFPALDAEIKFLSDPNVEKTFNYSFDELAKQGGYHEILILAIEKAIENTLKDINAHLESGDLFDGVSSWISKESPLYEILKNKKNL